MTANADYRTARRFFTSKTATSYDFVVKCATLNQDIKWKKQVSVLSRTSSAVLDLACGTGILSQHLRDENISVLAGLDLTREFLFAFERKIGVPAAQGTAESLPFREDLFDAVVSSYLAKYIDPEKVVNESYRVLKPGGLLVFHDFSMPSVAAIRLLWKMHFGILRLAGLFAHSWQIVFNELRQVIEQSTWEEVTVQALKSNGFEKISVLPLTFGTSCIISGRKP
ncbi:MAG: class I SAM-dependent methyltransferase [Nitrososphaera sp.]